ncbi:hypothetical protein [Mycolicibacterium baixiangningiae]|uniref:hypothetical protein n=1 Tax=Mycolicibacterium baixiangningiae TaxID=2761578 RepID=UPI0018677608|nr:hypothetical protein [Mycolicibacterium baixiangningiae]
MTHTVLSTSSPNSLHDARARTAALRHRLQIAGRDGGIGVRREALEDAFSNPVRDVERLVDNQGRVSYRYTGDDATVVVNEQGKVITGWANNSAGTGGAGGG